MSGVLKPHSGEFISVYDAVNLTRKGRLLITYEKVRNNLVSMLRQNGVWARRPS